MTIDELNALTTLTATDEVPVWDREESGEPTKKITAQNMANSVKSLASLPNTTEMNDAIAQSMAVIAPITMTPMSGTTIESDSKSAAYNKVVTLSVDIVRNSVTSSWVDYLSVPTAYSPKVPIYMMLYDNTTFEPILAYIDENGTLKLRNPVAGTHYYGTVTYIAK